MTKRIFTGIIVVSMVIMLACAGLIMGVMYDYLGKQVDKELKNQAMLVTAGLEQEGMAYLSGLSAEDELRSRVTLLDAGGDVLFDSMADETTMENHQSREEFVEAITSGEGHAVRDSATMASYTRYYAVKLQDGSVLRISTDHYSQLGLILDTFGMVVVIVAVLIGLGALISHNITRHIVKPINDIDLNHPDIEENYEELAPLLHRIHQQNNKIRRQMEALRRQQDEFRIITDNMKEGLLTINKDKEVLTYNRSAAQALGIGESPVREGALATGSLGNLDGLGSLGGPDSASKGVGGVMAPGLGEPGRPVNVLMLNRNAPFRRTVEGALGGKDCRNRMELGGEIYEFLGSPVLKDNQVTGAVLIIINVTAQEEGERMRREFTSNVSHELKTPLTSIYGVSDMLTSGIVKPEDVGQFARTIKEESSRLISLIDDIIKLSRLDENDVPREKTPVDLFLVVQDVVERLQSRAQAQNVSLKLEGEKAMVLGVDSILDEIVYNLCENAIKYNREGGQVLVKVGVENGDCVLRVSDTGVGIPREERSRVFERFYRVDKSHCGRIPGTGLGLSIVKHGVAYHDGIISLDSNEGVGTTVTVRLALLKDAE